MDKRLNKPYTKNGRLDKACGLPGVPPDAAVKIYVPVGTVVIITDRPVLRCKEIKLPQ